MGIMRQLITPFYKTRTGKAKRRTAKTRGNVTAIRRNRAAASDVKALRKAGILK
jgi:hypothetical protein